MLRHTVLVTFVDDVDDDEVTSISTALDALVRELDPPGLVAYRHGPDVGVDDDTADYAIVADFVDVASYESYRDDADHREFIADHLAGRIARRTAVQYAAADLRE